jgi:hypothetical protein
MLTVKQAIDSGIEHALNGPSSHAFEGLMLLNLAGQHLVGMNRWEWCKRRTARLNLRAGRDMIELPDDFAGLEAIQTIDNTSLAVRLVSQPELLSLKAQQVSLPASVFFVAEAYTDDDNDPQRRNTPALEVFPTPEQDVAGFFTITYRGGWPQVTNEMPQETALPLPNDGSCDGLFLTILRAFARGFEEDDQRSIEQELARVAMGPIFMAAKAADARRFENRGTLRNGLLARANLAPRPYRLYLNSLPEGLDA